MCGVAGILSLEPINTSEIEGMTISLRHRGPDAQSFMMSEGRFVALGHTRLSVIDLSAAANQPFQSANGRYVVVFNGEIYNFHSIRKELAEQHNVSFRTTSDTEVLVEGFAIWGVQITSRLEGMFAFAILDQHTEKLHLFRDRVGKKPLFYYEANGLFVFASEIKALLKHPIVASNLRLRRNSMTEFLHLGYIPEPNTIYANIFKFRAGHYGVVERGVLLRSAPYWRLSDYFGASRIDDLTSAKKQLHALLDMAVQDRLISDVPIGAFLSGGTDSSLVSAVASRLTTGKLKTFSIGFEENKFDESKYAREVANHLGTDHEEFIVRERDAFDLVSTYLHHFDEPFADTSAIPTMLVSKLARKQVTVALTGDGGDELFLGYGAYAWAERFNSRIYRAFRRPARLMLNATANSRALRVAHLLESVPANRLRSHIFSQEQYFFSQSELSEVLLDNASKPQEFMYSDQQEALLYLSAPERQALFDFQYYLKDDLLVKVDRASMYYGLECRCPLLDHRIVEFAYRLSPSMKVRNGTSKWILKELLRTYLPDALVDRQKWGFSIPLAKWMKGDLRYLIEETLSDRELLSTGLFDVRYVNKLKRNFLNGQAYLFNRLWALAVLQKWLKENGIDASKF